MKKYFIVAFMYALPAMSYCVPDNETCFDCGANCIAELTYSKGENNQNIGTMTIYGTNNGVGTMDSWSYSGEDPNRTTTAPWKDKLSDINNVVVSEGVVNVGGYTFSGAKNLSHVELPQSVNTIDIYAFLDSTLETVNTLKNVTSFGAAAFYSSNLRDADLSENLTEIPRDLFVGTNISSIKIPDNLTSIGAYAFAVCHNVTQIEIPDSVTNIGYMAFAYMNNLTDLTIPDTLELQIFDGDITAFSGLDLNSITFHCAGVLEQCKANMLAIGYQEGTYTMVQAPYSKKQADGSVAYYGADGKFKGYKGKRIYTLDEANKATGAVNRVSIKYR
ncbi:MAG: leucine-rich repeat domain-containing protein [Alphaproteobacteria bacterium]|nr:leucine-rich repeat domain-containing protein [Alphaproteobacteria bacterium]